MTEPIPPGRWWGDHLRETRCVLEAARLSVDPVWHGRGRIPPGDGRAVVLVPGFLGGDHTLAALARWLRRIGYRPAVCGFITNADCSERALERVERHVDALHGARSLRRWRGKCGRSSTPRRRASCAPRGDGSVTVLGSAPDGSDATYRDVAAAVLGAGSATRADGLVGAPIVVEDRLWGVVAASEGAESLPPGAEERLARFTDLVATAIANAESRAEVAASRARVVAAGEEERERVVRDLHDRAQQGLVHTIITVELAAAAYEEGDEEAPALMAEALEHGAPPRSCASSHKASCPSRSPEAA